MEPVITGPTNVVHRVHVDLDYTWSGNEDPSEIFEVHDILGEGLPAPLLAVVYAYFQSLRESIQCNSQS